MHAEQPVPVSLERLLLEARRGLRRLEPAAAAAAMSEGAVLVDIRSETQRRRDGVVPGAVFVARNVLEWRCAPSSPTREEELSDPELWLIVMCDGGYQSSLAAATLRQLGLPRATDLAGGFQAWRAAGLPVEIARARAAGRSARGHAPAHEFGRLAQG